MAPNPRSSRLDELRQWASRGQSSEGWDFAHLGVEELDPLPWEYVALARSAVANATVVLDLGTGGGERLAEIIEGSPVRAIATEEWLVNVRLARERLGALGGDVVRYSSERILPFRGASFDVVLDRHESLDPIEVARVLRPGGCVLTQQVGHDNWPELRDAFPRATRFPDHRSAYRAAFEAVGCETSLRQHTGRVRYPSLGQYVYQVAAAPWELADFDIEADLDAWLALEHRCLTPTGLVVTETRYLLEARKPPRSS